MLRMSRRRRHRGLGGGRSDRPVPVPTERHADRRGDTDRSGRDAEVRRARPVAGGRGLGRSVPRMGQGQRGRGRVPARSGGRGGRGSDRRGGRPRCTGPGPSTHGGEGVRGPSRWAALALGLSIVASLALFGVYVGGGNPQAEGALLFVALGGMGAALMIWARTLMPEVRDHTAPRHHGPERSEELEGAAETVTRGVDEMRRRSFLFRFLIGAAGALGLAAIITIRSLGRAPGSSLFHTQWR